MTTEWSCAWTLRSYPRLRFHRAQELVLPNFCPNPSHWFERTWHNLDIWRALRIYLKRTSSLRRTESLFVFFQPATLGQWVTLATLGRLIRATIAEAYGSQALSVPRCIMAHSTRSAATSTAWAMQASLEEVCRTAAWSSPSPFICHYKLDMSAEAAFGFYSRFTRGWSHWTSGVPPIRTHCFGMSHAGLLVPTFWRMDVISPERPFS